MILNFDDYKDLIPLTPYPHATGFLDSKRKNELCDKLLKFLLKEKGMIAAFNTPYESRMNVIRSYMNERSPFPVPDEILAIQDELLWHETLMRGIVDVKILARNKKSVVWQGDITRLKTDAIVNAANSDLLGCFIPCHNCIDNMIHSRAGMQVRRDCSAILSQQGEIEPIGGVKVTRAYNLPSTYIFHTVGPMTTRTVTDEDRANLKSCYVSCLELAKTMNLKSIAFCCISTGIFNFPRGEAAGIAVGAVKNWQLRNPDYDLCVVFDTYSDEDYAAYTDIFRFL